jgi:hypothetical protein
MPFWKFAGVRALAGAAADGAPRSGDGSPVRCFELDLEPPRAEDAADVSFRVRRTQAGEALRRALETGAVRYCAAEDVVYRARVVRPAGERPASDSLFDVLLAAPGVGAGGTDPPLFPAGLAAASGYVLPTPPAAEEDAGAGGDAPPHVSAYMVFF